MSALRASLLGVAVSAAVLLAAVPAQARFGKHSESSSSSNSDDDSDKHEVKPAPPPSGSKGSGSSSSSSHGVSPAPAPSSGPSDHGSSSNSGHPADHQPPRHDGPPHHHHGRYHYGWGFGYYPYAYPSAPAGGYEQDPAPAAVATVSLTGQLHNQDGGSLGLDAAAEGERWGVHFAATGIYAPVEGSANAQYDVIKLLDLHATYAVLAGPHGRLRLELGATSAIAPDITFMAPDAGLSGAVGLVGPLGLEASVAYTPWPFQRVDAFAGASLSVGALGLRAGWRHLWLDDRGAVDGVRHTDTFTGPFMGLSFAL